jgi:hypothetical protein
MAEDLPHTAWLNAVHVVHMYHSLACSGLASLHVKIELSIFFNTYFHNLRIRYCQSKYAAVVDVFTPFADNPH